MTKPGQSEPLDLTSRWVSTFTFSLKTTLCFFHLQWKSSDIYNYEQGKLEHCTSSSFSPTIHPFSSFSFFFLPTLRTVDYLNLALTFYDNTMTQEANLWINLAPGKLHCDSISWHLDIKVKSGLNRILLNRLPIHPLHRCTQYYTLRMSPVLM